MSSDALSSSRHSLSDADNDDDNEEEVIQETTSRSGGDSQRSYITSGNKKTKLYLLCVGLNQDQEPPFSFEAEPWSLLPKTAKIRPRNTDYLHEIVRRATLFNITPIPRPSSWDRVQTMEWLWQNPVRDRGAIEFLTNKVLRLKESLD